MADERESLLGKLSEVERQLGQHQRCLLGFETLDVSDDPLHEMGRPLVAFAEARSVDPWPLTEAMRLHYETQSAVARSQLTVDQIDAYQRAVEDCGSTLYVLRSLLE